MWFYLRFAIVAAMLAFVVAGAYLHEDARSSLQKYQHPLRAKFSRTTFYEDIWLAEVPAGLKRKYILGNRLGLIGWSLSVPLFYSFGSLTVGTFGACVVLILVVAGRLPRNGAL